MPPISIETLAERFSGFQRITEERFKGQQDALKLQALEYERRLDALNGEAGRIAKSQALHVSREMFDTKVGDLERRSGEHEKHSAHLEGRLWGIGISIGVAITVVNLVINVALHFIK